MKINNNIDTIKLRIVLLPNETLSTLAISLAKHYSEFGKTYFYVNSGKVLPHISVYYGKFPSLARENVFEILENFSSKYSQVVLEYDKIENLEGWLMMEFKLVGDLQKMHKELLEKLYPFGEVHSYNTLENYHPHLTLLRYHDKKIGVKNVGNVINLRPKHTNFRCAYIAVAYAEDHGTVTKIIKKYKLNV